MKKYSKLVIFSAPSGAGKTTIVQHLLKAIPNLTFSISATTRPKRGKEVDGVDYYFLTVEAFKEHIAKNEFVEYEEVYKDNFYGTLKPELKRINAEGKIALFDVDVKGGINLKQKFKDNALAVFVSPPSLEQLEIRLKNRNTETPESLAIRVAKASYEMTFQDQFDIVLVNDKLDEALDKAVSIVTNFLEAE